MSTTSANKPDLKPLGKHLSKMRRSRGLSIERLAYQSGLSKGNLSDIEQGKRDPRYTTLSRIAEGLGLALSQLLEEI